MSNALRCYLTLKNISFFDALGYSWGCIWTCVDDNAVVILPRDDWHDEDEDCDDDDDDDWFWIDQIFEMDHVLLATLTFKPLWNKLCPFWASK